MNGNDEDKEVECPGCGRVIKGSEEIRWLDKDRNRFKCLECGKEIEIHD